MTKKELTSFVRRSLIGREAEADEQRTYHWKRVEQAVGYAFDNLLAQIPMDAKGKAKIESYYVKHYYNQEVKESDGYRYFGVSDDVVPVGEGRGIWYVQPSGGGSLIPFSHRPHISVFNSMAVGEVMAETFWRHGNLSTNKQIILESIGTPARSQIRTVDFGVVRAFSSYSESESIEIPDGRADILIDFCRTWLDGAYVDKTNNNA